MHAPSPATSHTQFAQGVLTCIGVSRDYFYRIHGCELEIEARHNILHVIQPAFPIASDPNPIHVLSSQEYHK